MPQAYDGTGPAVDLVARIEGRLAHAPTDRVRDLRLALTVLGSRAAAFLFSGGNTTPFPRLSAERQDALLRRWATSPVMTLRAVYQGVRRLVLAVYYAAPESYADIGYLGPLHLREAVFAWEGPAPGVAPPNADEPVARRGESPNDSSRWRDRVRPAPTSGTTATSYPDRSVADVIVVGSGAGGSVAAARLAERGRDVLLIEEGSLVSADELTEDEGDMTARLYAEGGMRATDDLSVMILQGAAVGGGTLVNWMITFRAPDWVLDEWGERLRIPGFSTSEMAPVFDRVEREIHATRVPDDAHSPANRILLDGAHRLGWRATTGRINARGCIRAGFCGQGCR